jgi:hypothetical protein
MRPRDWFTVAGVLLLALGLLAFWAALLPPSPVVMPSNPKQYLNVFNAVRGVGSVWVGVGIAAAGVIVIVIGQRFTRE